MILTKQMKNPLLRKICQDMLHNIDYGISISETMLQYPSVFDNLTIALISVWEKTGTLGKILSEIEKNMAEKIELQAKVKSALIYPFILIGLTVAMITFMMVFIIPKIAQVFETTNTPIPKLTQIVLDISYFFRYKWYILLGGIALFFIVLKIMQSFFWGKRMLSYIAIHIPIFGWIVKQSNVIYFINSFNTLSESWILLLDALKTTSTVVPNMLYKEEIIRIKNEVESWLPLSKSLWLSMEYNTVVYSNKLFPEEFAYIVNIGEETGTLNESLKKLWINYTAELKRYIANLSTLIEPIVMIFIGVSIGFIVIAIMLPFFQLGKLIKKM